MHILVTNDDGVTAPGLLALSQALRPLGKVSVVAPDKNWSVCGHVKTLERPMRVKEVHLADGSPALTTDGAPADCVALAVLGLLPEKIDLVVSGINPNANLGHDLTYSGTVTAAMEAIIAGIPGIAVSINAPEFYTGGLDYSAAGRAAHVVAQAFVAHGASEPLLLNVNVPYLPWEKIKGICVTRQGTRIYRDTLEKRVDPRRRPYYWFGGEAPDGIPEEGTDIGALVDGYISLTPLQLDFTDYTAIQRLNSWQWEKYTGA